MGAFTKYGNGYVSSCSIYVGEAGMDSKFMIFYSMIKRTVGGKVIKPKLIAM